jgi:MerR family transcriptional regulator/heat shock protein HspR
MCVCWCRFVISSGTGIGKRVEEIFVASRSSRGTTPPGPASDGTTGVYGITVAAQLTGMSVQALRLYERKGLLDPARTTGGTRRYSDADIARLHRIGALIADGINLTGIARILGLEADNTDLHTSNAALHATNNDLENNIAALRTGRS